MFNKQEKWQDQIKVNFSADSDLKESLRAKLLQSADIREGHYNDIREEIPMKKGIVKFSRVAVIAAVTLVLMSATALAVGMRLSLGPFAHYSTETHSAEEAMEMLEEHRADWEGKVFDKNGKPITDLAAYYLANPNDGAIYDAQGNELSIIIEDETRKLAFGPRTEDKQNITTKFTTQEAAQPYVCFPIELPSYLPEGYALYCYEVYNGEDGVPKLGGKYLRATFNRAGMPDSEIYLNIQLMDEETAYEASGGEPVREIEINGHAAVTDDKNIDLLIGDIMYAFHPYKSGVSFDEILKMAESL